jgi:hypothetical protein
MQRLQNMKVLSSKIEVTYSGTNDQGEEVTLTKSANDIDPAWTAYLLRYVDHYRTTGKGQHGGKVVSMQGCMGDHPAVTWNLWDPSQPFLG